MKKYMYIIIYIDLCIASHSIRKEDYYYIEDDDEWVLIYDLFFIVL